MRFKYFERYPLILLIDIAKEKDKVLKKIEKE